MPYFVFPAALAVVLNRSFAVTIGLHPVSEHLESINSGLSWRGSLIAKYSL